MLYVVLWECLLNVFEKVGMKVMDCSCLLGMINVIVKLMSSSSWDVLGVKDLELLIGDYKL